MPSSLSIVLALVGITAVQGTYASYIYKHQSKVSTNIAGFGSYTGTWGATGRMFCLETPSPASNHVGSADFANRIKSDNSKFTLDDTSLIGFGDEITMTTIKIVNVKFQVSNANFLYRIKKDNGFGYHGVTCSSRCATVTRVGVYDDGTNQFVVSEVEDCNTREPSTTPSSTPTTTTSPSTAPTITPAPTWKSTSCRYEACCESTCDWSGDISASHQADRVFCIQVEDENFPNSEWTELSGSAEWWPTIAFFSWTYATAHEEEIYCFGEDLDYVSCEERDFGPMGPYNTEGVGGCFYIASRTYDGKNVKLYHCGDPDIFMDQSQALC